ncbi:MAG: alpha-amylase family glycosyl hydrolase [Chloroherpetonaceae bacterium]|nr:alpha-amylase family glycosyl hydrolase [Chloroherpetonaceae bacterium]
MKNFLRIFFLFFLFFLSSTIQAQNDFREETIYFLMTSRFYDGDTLNSKPTEWSSFPRPQITNPKDVTWRGDFKGLIQKLDYIKDLGFTAIWITPIVQNRSPLDYHGYHAWDFTRVDPRLESPGYTFKTLIDSAHSKGLKIILDVVLNHAGRFGVKGKAEIKYNTDTTQAWGKDSQGKALKDNPNWQYDGVTPNPDDGKIWSRANVAKMPPPFNQNLSLYNWPSKESYIDTSDPDWYHHSGNGFAQGYDDTTNLYQRALAGDTPDFHTRSDSVRKYLVEAYKQYIEMGIDGMRLDAIKHINIHDLLYFVDAFRAINPQLFFVGEVAQKRHELHQVEQINPHWYTWRNGVGSEPSGISVFDFYAMATFHLFEKGESFSGVTSASRYDHLYADPSSLVTFLDNHDFGPNNDWNRRFGNTAQNLAACLNFMFTWRGIPSVYYGTEMQFKQGAYTDIKDASDIERSIDLTGRAYYGDVLNQAPNHPIYKHIKKLNAIRKALPALQKGTWQWAGGGGGNGVGYIRKFGSNEVVVGLAKDGAVTFNFIGLTNGIYRDAVTGNEINVSNGNLSFTVQPSSAGIYVLNGPGLIGELGSGYFQSSSSGAGSGGGNSRPTVVSFNPTSPTPGSNLTVRYVGQLSTASQVNLYWGIDAWQSITTTQMQKQNDSTWQTTVTIPQNATQRFVCAFNNGSGTWDNNNGADFQVSLLGSGGGGNGNGITIYFRPPQNWNAQRIYFYEASPSVTTPSWDGSPSMSSMGNGWFSYTIPSVTSIRVIFRDNANNQIPASLQPGFIRTASGWYDGTTNSWTDSSPLSTPRQREIEMKVELLQNYPNPFNPSTFITYQLTEPSVVNLEIFDVFGRKVVTLVNRLQGLGRYSVRFDASEQKLSSGTYFYRINTKGTKSFSKTLKMTLVK